MSVAGDRSSGTSPDLPLLGGHRRDVRSQKRREGEGRGPMEGDRGEPGSAQKAWAPGSRLWSLSLFGHRGDNTFSPPQRLRKGVGMDPRWPRVAAWLLAAGALPLLLLLGLANSGRAAAPESPLALLETLVGRGIYAGAAPAGGLVERQGERDALEGEGKPTGGDGGGRGGGEEERSGGRRASRDVEQEGSAERLAGEIADPKGSAETFVSGTGGRKGSAELRPKQEDGLGNPVTEKVRADQKGVPGEGQKAAEAGGRRERRETTVPGVEPSKARGDVSRSTAEEQKTRGDVSRNSDDEQGQGRQRVRREGVRRETEGGGGRSEGGGSDRDGEQREVGEGAKSVELGGGSWPGAVRGEERNPNPESLNSKKQSGKPHDRIRRSRYRQLVLSPEEEARQQLIDHKILGAARAEIARSGPYTEDKRGKVALLFLTTGPLPLDLLWQRFLNGHEGEYAIHVHSSDADFRFDASTTRFPALYGREIPSIEIRWGSVTMSTATRRLLAVAMLDPTVERFVLLSETCIPIHNFTFLQDYLFATNKSHLASFRQGKRFVAELAPAVTLQQWRKGSQWFALTRRHAAQVVEDQEVYDRFKGINFKISDEHYIQTLMAILGEEEHLEGRPVTFAQFLPSRRRIGAASSHPVEFRASNVTTSLIRHLQNLKIFDHEPYKVPQSALPDPCTNGGKGPVPCYLFARKFMPSTLEKLLAMSEVLGY